MWKYIGITVLVLSALALGYMALSARSKKTIVEFGDLYDPTKCIPSKGSFESFNDNVNEWNWHLLNSMARSIDPATYQVNQSQVIEAVAGFFKAVDIKPTTQAYQAYKTELKSYVKNDGTSAYKVMGGALKCYTK